MAVKIRLQRKGRKKAPFYHIVVANSRSPRDGKFIERIGFYNPISVPASIDIDRDKAFDWLMKGAEPTDTVNAILRYKGVMYRKHLSKGVAKGAFDQEKADQLYKDWIEKKEGLINIKVESRKSEIENLHKSMTAVTKTKATKPVEVVEEVAEAVAEESSNEASESTAEDAAAENNEEAKAEE
ncbi:MAG: 30S ribosomal protein S16 [Saprospiraceae bacterium]|nr:30S ribosomal protein S16 [Candidatus Vicinibacter affinis]